jgi:hypothetical protein
VAYYWWRVVRRAFQDAREAIGHNWKKTVVSYVATGIAFGIFGYLEGGQQVWGKLEWWLSVVLGGVIVFVIILLWQILAVPPRLEVETIKTARMESERMQARLHEARASINCLSERLAAKPQYELERTSEVRNELAKSSPADRAMVRHILAMDGQTEDQLRRFCQARGLPWDEYRSAVTTGTCPLLRHDRGRFLVKEQLRTAVEGLIDQAPT